MMYFVRVKKPFIDKTGLIRWRVVGAFVLRAGSANLAGEKVKKVLPDDIPTEVKEQLAKKEPKYRGKKGYVLMVVKMIEHPEMLEVPQFAKPQFFY